MNLANLKSGDKVKLNFRAPEWCQGKVLLIEDVKLWGVRGVVQMDNLPQGTDAHFSASPDMLDEA